MKLTDDFMEKMFATKFLFAGKSILIKTNHKKLNKLFGVFLPEYASAKKTDLTLEYLFYHENFDLSLDILKKSEKEFEKIIFKKKNKNKIVFSGKKGKKGKKLVSGFLDLKKKHGKIEFRMHERFFIGFFVFSLAKCLGIYLNDFKGNVIHSSALAKNGKGLLFAGGDDTGKTTFSCLCGKCTVLGEDMNFLIKKGRKFFIQKFPFNSKMMNTNKENTKLFELKVVLFLAKSDKLKLKKLTNAESTANMLENDIQGTLNFHKIKTKERISLYTELFSCIPGFVFCFPLKKNLWKELEKKLKRTVNLK